MKILVIETIAATPHLETAGEIALRLKQKKHNVSFAWVGFNLPWNDWELSLKAKALGGSFENKVHEFSKIIAKKDIKVERVSSPNNYDKIYKWSNNFNGNLLVNTYNGNIAVATSPSRVEAESRHGTLINNLDYTGQQLLKLKTIDGNITITKSQ